MTREKVISIISGLTFTAGFFMLIGSAGMSDCNLISFGSLVRRLLIGVALLGGGALFDYFGGGGLIDF